MHFVNLPSTSVNRFITSFRSIASNAITTALVVLVSQMWIRGVPLRSSLLFGLWFFCNFICGAWLYHFLIRGKESNAFEELAIGSTIGIVTTAIVDQIFVLFGVVGFAAKLVTLAGLLLFLTKKSVLNKHKPTSYQKNLDLHYALVAAVFFPLSSLDYISFPAIPVLFLSFLAIKLQLFDKFKWLLFYGSVAIFSLIQLRLISNITAIPRLLIPLSTGSDDQIKSEQLSWSIANWGLNTRSSAIDFPIKFHWLSLAWSGSISTAFNTSPFEVTLHLIPVFGFLVIAVFGIAIAIRISSAPFVSFIAPLILTSSSGFLGQERFFFVLTTTNLIPHLLIISLFVFLFNHFNSMGTRINLAIITVMPALIMLGKGPYVISVLAGLCFLMTSRGTEPELMRPFRIAVITSVVNTSLAYILFFRSDYTDTYILSINRIINDFPSPLLRVSISNPLIQIFLSLAVFGGFLFFRFPLLYLFKMMPLPIWISRFFFGGFSAALVSFIAYQQGSSTYFMDGSLTFAAVASIFLLTRTQVSLNLKPSKLELCKATMEILFISLTMLVLGQFRFGKPAVLITILVSWIACLVLYSTTRYLTRDRFGRFVLAVLITPVLLSLTSFSFNRIEDVPSAYSLEELEMYQYIRKNVPLDDVIATNRELCKTYVTCGLGEGMPVATAFSQRQYLVEGVRSFLPTRFWNSEYPEIIQIRVDAIYEFIENPSEVTFQQLKKLNVSWILVYSKQGTPFESNEFTTLKFATKNFELQQLNS